MRTTILISCLVAAIQGCRAANDAEMVVYSAADQDFAEPVFNEFESETGIKPLGKFDVESTKTVGLVNAILAEATRPRCDVFWNNEILHTLRLRKRGMLEPYQSPVGAQYPPAFRSSDGTWYGFGARARVLIVNTDLVPADERPTSVQELADARWTGRVGIAKPLFGTTATHATVLFHRWGTEKAEAFFRQVKSNAQVLSGNRRVSIAVGRGQLAWGLTDTDDAYQAWQKGEPVEIVYPDQGGEGTLLIPNTVAIIKGAPHESSARRFVDFLLSAATEGSLAQSPSAQFPLHPDSQHVSPLGELDAIQVMEVDFEAAAERWHEAAEFLRDTF